MTILNVITSNVCLKHLHVFAGLRCLIRFCDITKKQSKIWYNILYILFQVFTCDIYLRQVWHDPDFDFGGIIDQHVIYVPDYIQPSIWTPDTFIQNSKQAIEHTTTQPNRGLFVYGNGTLFYSNR